MSKSIFEIIRVIYDYKGVEDENLLSLSADEAVYITRRTKDGWCFGVTGGLWGWFPNSYVIKMIEFGEIYEWKWNEICKILESKEWTVYWKGECKLKVFKKDRIKNVPMTMDYSNFTISINSKWVQESHNGFSQNIISVKSKSSCFRDTEIEQVLSFQKSNNYSEVSHKLYYLNIEHERHTNQRIMEYTTPTISENSGRNTKKGVDSKERDRKGKTYADYSNDVRKSQSEYSMINSPTIQAMELSKKKKKRINRILERIRNIREKGKTTRIINSFDNQLESNQERTLINGKYWVNGLSFYRVTCTNEIDFQNCFWQHHLGKNGLKNLFISYELKKEKLHHIYDYFSKLSEREIKYANSFDQLKAYDLQVIDYTTINDATFNLLSFHAISAKAHRDYADNIFNGICLFIKKFIQNITPLEEFEINAICQENETLEEISNKIQLRTGSPLNVGVIHQCVVDKCSVSQFSLQNFGNMQRLSEEVKNRRSTQLILEYNRLLKEYKRKHLQVCLTGKQFEKDYLNLLKGTLEKAHEFQQQLLDVKTKALLNVSKSLDHVEIKADTSRFISNNANPSNSPLAISFADTC